MIHTTTPTTASTTLPWRVRSAVPSLGGPVSFGGPVGKPGAARMEDACDGS